MNLITSSTKPMLWTGRNSDFAAGLFSAFRLQHETPKSASSGRGHSARRLFRERGRADRRSIADQLAALPDPTHIDSRRNPLTGYLGGATATMVRMNDPWFFLPVVIGILVWLALYLRDEQLRAMIPIRR